MHRKGQIGALIPGDGIIDMNHEQQDRWKVQKLMAEEVCKIEIKSKNVKAIKTMLKMGIKGKNGQLSSENLQASAEAAVADQLPPGAHPVDLRSATTTPPPADTPFHLLQPLLDSPAPSPTPPPPLPLHEGGPRPSPTPSPTATSAVVTKQALPSRQQHLQVPIDGTRLIPLSPTVILRHAETEKRPPDVVKEVVKNEKPPEPQVVEEEPKLNVKQLSKPEIAVDSHQTVTTKVSQAQAAEVIYAKYLHSTCPNTAQGITAYN
ncbi:hypothetical protein ACTXT7_009637 [Hymenolepis weldensis]